jgi:hypothetical protein
VRNAGTVAGFESFIELSGHGHGHGAKWRWFSSTCVALVQVPSSCLCACHIDECMCVSMSFETPGRSGEYALRQKRGWRPATKTRSFFFIRSCLNKYSVAVTVPALGRPARISAQKLCEKARGSDMVMQSRALYCAACVLCVLAMNSL